MELRTEHPLLRTDRSLKVCMCVHVAGSGGEAGWGGLWGVVGCGQLQDKIQEFSYLNVNLNLSFWPVT